MTYLLIAIGLTPGGSSTVHICTQTIHRTTQWKQNIQNRTYITIRIHKHKNKKKAIYKIKQKHTKHTTIYTMIKNGTKRTWKNVINEKAI
jgi:gamma-glutamyltranspeptidase